MSEKYQVWGRKQSSRLDQGITEVSATAKYDIGVLMTDTMGNKYRYGKTGGSSVLTQRGAWTYNYQISGHLAVPTTSAIGARVVYATVTITDGIAGDGVIAADYLKDGYVIIWHADATIIRARILSNTAVAAGGGTIALTIEGVLPAAVTLATETLELIANPWLDARTGNGGSNHAFIGQPMGPLVTAYPYGWFLTHGPTFIDPQATVGLAYKQEVCFRHDGSIDVFDDTSAYTKNVQRAGYVLSNYATGLQAAPLIMLDLE